MVQKPLAFRGYVRQAAETIELCNEEQERESSGRGCGQLRFRQSQSEMLGAEAASLRTPGHHADCQPLKCNRGSIECEAVGTVEFGLREQLLDAHRAAPGNYHAKEQKDQRKIPGHGGLQLDDKLFLLGREEA